MLKFGSKFDKILDRKRSLTNCSGLAWLIVLILLDSFFEKQYAGIMQLMVNVYTVDGYIKDGYMIDGSWIIVVFILYSNLDNHVTLT